MFSSIFGSKTQKLVKKWEKEHQEIVVIATKVIENYNTHNYAKAKKYLSDLNSLAVSHIMNEDIEFYKLLRDKKRIDKETDNMINEFTQSFKDTKLALMNFLYKYTRDDTKLDQEFFDTFTKIIDVVGKRIDFEEKNLYQKLKDL